MEKIVEIYDVPGLGRRLRQISPEEAAERELVEVNDHLYTSLPEFGYVEPPPPEPEPEPEPEPTEIHVKSYDEERIGFELF